MASRKSNNNVRASDHAYVKIRQAIISGEFPNGSKLNKRTMADYCGVSIIPVIDALNRLENEGLVESNPYSGSRVINLDTKKINDSYLLREAIETQVVRVLCYTIGIDEINYFKEKAICLDKLAGKREDNPYYDNQHYEFHLELAKSTRSKLLVEELEKIQLFSLLVKAESKYHMLGKDEVITSFSHLDIIDAISHRNPEKTSQIMRQHIYRSHIVKIPLWVD